MYVRIILPRAVLRSLLCCGAARAARVISLGDKGGTTADIEKRKAEQHQGPARLRLCGGSIRLLTSMI